MNHDPQTIETLEAIVAQYGTPCFVYFMDDIVKRVDSVHQAFGGRFQISYAIKANPNPTILTRLQDEVEMLDISSGGELRLALSAGWRPEQISFTGPGKTSEELRAAVELGINEVVVESVDEARALNELAATRSRASAQRILVRVAPSRLPRGFGVRMAGKPCQFGIDEEVLDAALEDILALAHVDLRGFHIYSGTQCLHSGAVAENYGIFLDLFRHAAERHDLRPEKLIFGSGLGIRYHADDNELDLQDVARRVNPRIDALLSGERYRDTTCALEIGRYLVGEAGLYVTKVLRVKRSRGADIAICDGGMNHHLGACGHLGSVLHRNYRMFKVMRNSQGAENRPYDIVGPLCTSIDKLGSGVMLPGLAAGDLLAVCSSGAYGPSASPINFIHHAPPQELLVETEGGETVITRVSAVDRVASQ